MPQKSISKICSVRSCNAAHHAKGFCARHYASRRRVGDHGIPRSIPNTVALTEKIERCSEKVTESGCWIWMKGLTGGGYGRLHTKKGKMDAHRASYIAFHGSIPEGLYVLHTCDTPSCVNPNHLFTGSQHDNMVDAAYKLRLRHGSNSHMASLTEEQVLEIRARSKEPYFLLATEYQVTRQTINHIVLGRSWKHSI